jgi:hypothetical protein
VSHLTDQQDLTNWKAYHRKEAQREFQRAFKETDLEDHPRIIVLSSFPELPKAGFTQTWLRQLKEAVSSKPQLMKVIPVFIDPLRPPLIRKSSPFPEDIRDDNRLGGNIHSFPTFFEELYFAITAALPIAYQEIFQEHSRELFPKEWAVDTNTRERQYQESWHQFLTYLRTFASETHFHFLLLWDEWRVTVMTSTSKLPQIMRAVLELLSCLLADKRYFTTLVLFIVKDLLFPDPLELIKEILPDDFSSMMEGGVAIFPVDSMYFEDISQKITNLLKFASS